MEEAWIDSGLTDELSALAFGRHLRQATLEQVGFEVSIGIAWCKAYAKLASLAAKPPAVGLQVATRHDELQALFARTPIAKARHAHFAMQCSSPVVPVSLS